MTSGLTCTEPLVWTCKSCGHSFHENEWRKSERTCPACEKSQGVWKCSLCQATLPQPALGNIHPCHSGSATSKNTRFTYNSLSSKRTLISGFIAFVFFTALIGSAFLLSKCNKTNSAASSSLPSAPQTTKTEENKPMEEYVCNEGWVEGIVYDTEGSVGIRANPDATSKIIYKVKSGTPTSFRVLENGWGEAVVYEKGYEDQTDKDDICYIHQTRLFMKAKNTDPTPPTKIRAGPGYDTAIVGEIGVDVPVYMQSDEQADWVAVVAGDINIGFIHGFVRKEVLKGAIE